MARWPDASGECIIGKIGGPDGQTKMVSELLEREGQVARGKW